MKNAYGTNYSGLLAHFVTAGMREGRVASQEFSVVTYKSKYTDLRNAFGNNWKLYFSHYIMSGQKEGRSGL